MRFQLSPPIHGFETWEADFLQLKASFLGEEVGEAVLPEEAEPFPLSVNQEKGMKGDPEERLEPSINSLHKSDR